MKMNFLLIIFHLERMILAPYDFLMRVITPVGSILGIFDNSYSFCHGTPKMVHNVCPICISLQSIYSLFPVTRQAEPEVLTCSSVPR